MDILRTFLLPLIYGGTISLLVALLAGWIMYALENTSWLEWAVGIFLACYLWVFVRAFQRANRIYMPEPVPDELPEQVVRHVTEDRFLIAERENDPQFIQGINLADIPVSQDVLYHTACRILNGTSFTFKNFTMGKSKLMSRPELEKLRGLFLMYGWMAQKDEDNPQLGVEVTGEGYRWFRAIKMKYERPELIDDGSW